MRVRLIPAVVRLAGSEAREAREIQTVAVVEPEHLHRKRASMPEKTRRRLMLEQSLAEDPTDSFLRYGLAIQCLREGDVAEGRERLLALIADRPDDQVAAYQQLGQSYADGGERPAAIAILQTGMSKAKAAGDWHAAGEMEQMLHALA